MASRFDDRDGVAETYYFFRPRRGISPVTGSSMVFTMAVNATLPVPAGGCLTLTRGEKTFPGRGKVLSPHFSEAPHD